MAKTTSVKKADTKKTPVKKETKKTVTKTETVASSKEVKKIAAKAEPKKLTTAKAPAKITAKPEPKKITVAKEPVKLTVKEEVKPKETKSSTPKKAIKKPAKATIEPKQEVTKVKPAKATKTVTKKTTTKKAVKKSIEKPKKDKLAYYNELPLEECIRLMQEMQVHYTYDDYYMLLMDEENMKTLEKNIIDGNHIKAQNYTFEAHGYDEDLVIITLEKVSATMDIKAADFKDLKKRIVSALKFNMGDDPEKNAEEYLGEFALSEKLLMIGQRKNINTATEVSELVGAKVEAYFAHFFDLAYEILPTWQYNDVLFYEDFAYAIMSQYTDVFETEQLRVQIDVADLYIKHGDYQHGDEMYGYILRDNNIKDYIYYRYATIYKDIDYNKAKSIAYSSLQYVDERFAYYPSIMEIIHQ